MEQEYTSVLFLHISFHSSTNSFVELISKCNLQILILPQGIRYIWRTGLLSPILTTPRGLPGLGMVARDAQTNLLPNFKSPIWLMERNKKKVVLVYMGKQAQHIFLKTYEHKLTNVSSSINK